MADLPHTHTGTPTTAAAGTPAAAPPATTAPPAATQAQQTQQVQLDSDDDDFDDDDLLGEFQLGDIPAPTATSATQSTTQSAAQPQEVDDEWARMLQEGMRDLLKDVDENPEMHGQFEALAKELNEAMAASTSAGEARPGTSSSTAAPSGSFQDQIRQTMERMKSSSAEVDAGLAEDVDDDFLAQMLKSMGGGEAGEEDFSNMLVNMMEQLTSKEILYEPMKELNEKYPAWMKENEPKTKKEDLERYRVQMGIVREIVERFDRPSYKDENEEDREYIVERMQKMQSAGAPPAELMGDMTEGMQPPDMSAGDCGVQ